MIEHRRDRNTTSAAAPTDGTRDVLADDEEEPFEQSERRTVRLKGLIRNYPRGIGIIKEFLQNADDAGATRLSVVMDWRCHSPEGLPDPRMAALLGPALLISNDKPFTDEDVSAIQRIGEGSKREAGPKIGRFGYGFNTAYNVTDYPSFVTGERAYCFDPHRNAVGSSQSEGKKWRLDRLWKQGHFAGTFVPGGLAPGAGFHGGTIFRLPLRTPEAARRSEISSEPFVAAQFYEIVDRLNETGSSLLLFTRHLLSFSVAEIPAQGADSPTLLLEVATVNHDEVVDSRAPLNNESDGNLGSLLERWRCTPHALPSTSYRHNFLITTPQGTERDIWQVSTGLFSDAAGETLATARAMLDANEKAIPWAGVAARLSVERNGSVAVVPVVGRVYAGLPLPQETSLPVHINGYFDIDSSRTHLTSDIELLDGMSRLRCRWNELLLAHGVARAYGELLESLAEMREPLDVSSFYRLFPSSTGASPFNELANAVFRDIAERPLIRVATGVTTSWVQCKNVVILPTRWRARLHEPLVADGVALPEPPLPNEIVNGFTSAKLSLSSFTPAHLRNRLRTGQDVDTTLENARPCLSRRQWLEELLRYALSDDVADLKGLPLAFLCDGRLHTFGHSAAKDIYRATDKQRLIFSSFPHWFIDPSYQEATGVAPNPEARFYSLRSDTVLKNLRLVFEGRAEDDDSPLVWDRGEDAIPNELWLTRLFEYLAGQPPSDMPSLRDVTKYLPLVPDQFDRLHIMGSKATPLLPPAERGRESLLHALHAVRAPIVTGSNPLVAAIRAFAAVHSNRIWDITGPDIVDLLSTYRDDLIASGSLTDAAIHVPLLDYLSEERWLTQYSPEQLASLRTLPLFPTELGTTVAASTPGVFCSADFQPPPLSADVQVLSIPEGRNWRALAAKLGIESLDRRVFLTRVWLPLYPMLEHEDQRVALAWLRDNLSPLLSPNGGSDREGETIRRKLRDTRLVLCTDGALHLGRALTHPHETATVELLGENVFVPDMRYYASNQNRWLKLFADLGMEREPRASQLLAEVDRLIDATPESGIDTAGPRLLRILGYLNEHWEQFEKTTVAAAQGTRSISLGQALAQRSWLPSLQEPLRKRSIPGFVAFDDRLYAPHELYTMQCAHLVASQCPILAYPEEPHSAFRTVLRICHQPSLSVVVEHFVELLTQWEASGNSGIAPADIAASATRILRYLGNAISRSNTRRQRTAWEDMQPAAIAAALSHRRCVWDDELHTFRLPQHVFATRVPFFEPRRRYLSVRDEALEVALDFLGRRVTPTPDDFAQFLRDLASEFIDAPLPETEQKQALQALKAIADGMGEDPPVLTSLPVLSRDSVLRLGPETVLDDAPWLRGKIDDTAIHWLHSQVSSAAAMAAGVLRLSTQIVETLEARPSISNVREASMLAARLTKTIRSDQFRAGLNRLIQHEQPGMSDHDLNWLTSLSIIAVDELRTQLWLSSPNGDRLVGSGDALSYFSEDEHRLFVHGASERLFARYLAQAIRRKVPGGLRDLAPLEAIVTAQPQAISRELDSYAITAMQTVVLDLDWEEPEYGYDLPNGEMEDGALAASDDDGTFGEDPLGVPNSQTGCPVQPTERSPNRLDTHNSTIVTPDYDDCDEQTGDDSDHDGENRPALFAPYYRRRVAAGAEGSSANPRLSQERGTHPAGESSTGDPFGPGERNPFDSRNGVERPIPLASADRPPLSPGTGRSPFAGQSGSGARRRVVTYVAHDGAARNVASSFDHDARRVLHAEAIEIVRQFERKHNRDPHDASEDGYDLVSREGDSTGERFIKVEGVDGMWASDGVILRPREYRLAEEHGPNFWLYVVEHVRGPTTPLVLPIQHPVAAITEYRLDDGWRLLAKPASTALTVEPAIGLIAIVDDGVEAVIEQIEPFGQLSRLHLRLASGEVIVRTYRSSMTLRRPT